MRFIHVMGAFTAKILNDKAKHLCTKTVVDNAHPFSALCRQALYRLGYWLGQSLSQSV